MRLKGINPFEQHVEKIVAGVFALVLLGVLAMQFLTPQPKVKVGNQEESLVDAYVPIKKEAAQVNTKLQAQTPADLPTAPTNIFEDFEAGLRAPVAPEAQLPSPLEAPTRITGAGKLEIQAAAAIVELAIAPPTKVVAAPYLATVSTSEAQNPDVAKILPPANPLDKAEVAVEGVFDGAALKEALSAAPTGDKAPRSIPKNWWDGGTQILAVELHRQTMQPDGKWSPDEKIKGMPGRDLLVDKVDSFNDAVTLHDAAKRATDQAELIRRTPYYFTTFGEQWTPPSERNAPASDNANLISGLKRELQDADKDIQRLQDLLSKIGQPAGNQPGGGGGRPGGGGGRPGAGGGGGGGAPPSTSGPNSADESRRKALQLALKKAQDRKMQVESKLRELGEVIAGDTTTPAPDPTKQAKAEPPLLDNPAVRLWAHDVFVERGKTYRYQMVVVLTNPYFGHSAAMIPEQAAKLAKSGVIRSAASEWTDPITVDPDQYTFFTSASEDDMSSGRTATARAEIYKFKWGFWRKGTKELEPGDPVVADLKIPDFSKFLTGVQPGDVPGQPPQPGPVPTGRPGSRGLLPAPAPAPAPGGQDAQAVPAGTTIPMDTVEVDSKQIMLGVGSGPIRDTSGKEKNAAQVFIRDADGQVQTIVPDTQRQDPAYARVSHSALRGDKELQPPPPEKARPMPNMPQTDPGGRDPRKPPMPGGG